MAKKKKVGKKGKKAKSMLNDAARAIGSALGTLTVQADSLATKAKAIRLPSSAEEATQMVREMLSPKKKAVARRKRSPASRKK